MRLPGQRHMHIIRPQFIEIMPPVAVVVGNASREDGRVAGIRISIAIQIHRAALDE